MAEIISIEPNSDHELVICRVLNAPKNSVYRCWSEAALFAQWFAPEPWEVAKAELEVRNGGTSLIIMRSPDGKEFPSRGVFLEVIPGQKLIFTDAFSCAWEPSEKPFMVATVTFDDMAGKTRYTARVKHWTKEDCEAHVNMGFHKGWSQCAEQLEELAANLR